MNSKQKTRLSHIARKLLRNLTKEPEGSSDDSQHPPKEHDVVPHSGVAKPDPPSSIKEARNPKGDANEWREKWKFRVEVAGAVILLIYTGFAGWQAREMRSSVELSRQTFIVGQRSYVTIGRQDGTVADFVIPKDPSQNAEVVVYFQNSGNIPAKFAWGTTVGFLAAGGTKKNTGIVYTHPFKGLPSRTRDIKTGSTGEQGAADAVIAKGSIFTSTLGTISQKDLSELGPNNMGALILGMFEYCDELGTYSSREFGLRYRSNAPSTTLSFDLAHEGPSIISMMPAPKNTATIKYLGPCDIADPAARN